MPESPSTSGPSTIKPLGFRKLRIAVSAFFGVLTLLLVAVWARSYSYYESVSVSSATSKRLEIESVNGVANIALILKEDPFAPDPPGRFSYRRLSLPVGQASQFWKSGRYRASFGDHGALLRFPYWCAVVAMGVSYLVLVLTLPSRFSLRTLLIATTLLAVVLGLAVWAVR